MQVIPAQRHSTRFHRAHRVNHFSIDGQITFVSGAGTGIGKACALRLSQYGAKVIAVTKTSEHREALAKDLNSDCVVLALDLCTNEGIDSLIQHFREVGYPTTVIANLRARSSYTSLPNTPYFATSVELSSLLHLQKILPECLETQRRLQFGRWVGISSAVVQPGSPGQFEYIAAKSVLESMMKQIALENGRSNITANIVRPGFIDTPTTRHQYSKASFEKLSGMNLVGRSGLPEEVAHAVHYLCTPLASFTTGQILEVSGGFQLGWFFTNNSETTSAIPKDV